MFAPLIAAARAARVKIAKEGQEAAREFVGGYRTAPARAKKANDEIAAGTANRVGKEITAAQRSAREQSKAYADIYRSQQQGAKAAEGAADRALKKHEKARDAVISGAGRALGNVAMAGVHGAIGIGRRVVGAGIGLGHEAVNESLATQAIATRVSINARGAGQQGVDPSVLRKEFEAAAMANSGIKAEDVGKGAQAYVDLTGDLDTARASLKTFATVASATGATVTDVATAAASLGNKFDIKTVGDMQQVMAGLTFQGKGGAMTMKDLAAQFQKVAAAGAAFDIGKGPEAVAKLGGLMQIARSAAKSPQAAGTAVENVFKALTTKGALLKKDHVEVYDKQGGKRDINTILAEAVSQVGGANLEKKNAGLTKIFGTQGMRTINPLIAAYTDAARGKTGKEAQAAGYAAVTEKLSKMASIAADWSQIVEDAGQAQKDAGAQVEGAWQRVVAAAGDRLAPALGELAVKLTTGKGLDLFIGALGHAAEGVEAFAALLERLGLISGGTHAEKQEAAEKKGAALGKVLESMGGEKGYNALSDDKKAEYNKVNAQKLKADDEAKTERALAGGKAAGVSAIGAAKTPEEAKAIADMAYDRAGGGDVEKRANRILPDLLGDSDVFRGLLGEDKDQRDIRHAGEARSEQGGEFGYASLDTAADKHSAAADKTAAAADKLDAVADKLGSLQLPGAAPGATTGPKPVRGGH